MSSIAFVLFSKFLECQTSTDIPKAQSMRVTKKSLHTSLHDHFLHCFGVQYCGCVRFIVLIEIKSCLILRGAHCADTISLIFLVVVVYYYRGQTPSDKL